MAPKIFLHVKCTNFIFNNYVFILMCVRILPALKAHDFTDNTSYDVLNIELSFKTISHLT